MQDGDFVPDRGFTLNYQNVDHALSYSIQIEQPKRRTLCSFTILLQSNRYRGDPYVQLKG